MSGMRAATPEELRKRVEGWRAAERRERALRRAEGPLAPAEAMAAALELCALDPDSTASDPDRAASERSVIDAWQKLREGLGWRPSTTEQGA